MSDVVWEVEEEVWEEGGEGKGVEKVKGALVGHVYVAFRTGAGGVDVVVVEGAGFEMEVEVGSEVGGRGVAWVAILLCCSL